MLSHLADVLLPAVGRLTISADAGARLAPGSVVVANHTSLADPAVVIAALHRLGARPVVMAAAGLWRVPVLGRMLAHEGHIPVHRGDRRAADALDGAAAALERGDLVLLYAEGGLPRRKDAAEAAPGVFRNGLSRLVRRTGAPVVPLGQAGARRIVSGGVAKQLAGLCTAPLRRPGTARARGRAALGGRFRRDRAGPCGGDGGLAHGGRPARRARRVRRRISSPNHCVKALCYRG